jgi:hypothetical protein
MSAFDRYGDRLGEIGSKLHGTQRGEVHNTARRRAVMWTALVAFGVAALIMIAWYITFGLTSATTPAILRPIPIFLLGTVAMIVAIIVGWGYKGESLSDDPTGLATIFLALGAFVMFSVAEAMLSVSATRLVPADWDTYAIVAACFFVVGNILLDISVLLNFFVEHPKQKTKWIGRIIIAVVCGLIAVGILVTAMVLGASVSICPALTALAQTAIFFFLLTAALLAVFYPLFCISRIGFWLGAIGALFLMVYYSLYVFLGTSCTPFSVMTRGYLGVSFYWVGALCIWVSQVSVLRHLIGYGKVRVY